MLPETRYSLIARLARPEDVETWEHFVRTYEGAIIRYCRTRGLQDADASEVAQEVFVVVHKEAENWKPSGRVGSFRAWLFEIARRACLASMRKRNRETVGVDSEILSEPCSVSDANAHDEEWQRWAFCAAAQHVQLEVKPETWRAFWQTAIENQTPQQVADNLNISIGSVYTAKCRVMARIRKQINELSLA